MNRKAALFVALAGSALTVAESGAGHQGYWNSSDDFYVRVSYMVDFDQQREASYFNPPFVTGLPNSGNMYCVPTSSSNLMAYVDRHGYAGMPGVDGPGLEDWSDAGDVTAYNIATSYISDMGLDMNTSADGGTNNNNNQFYNAVRGRLPNLLFDVNYYGRTDTWAPKACNIGHWMAQGGIVQFCYGRWSIGASGDVLSERNGGHCVVMTKVDKRGFMGYDENEFVINYADPGSGGSSLFTQSDFAYRVMEVRDENYFLDGPGTFRRMSRVMFGGSGTHRLIDSALAIFPKSAWGVYPTPDQLTLYAGQFNAGGGTIAPRTFTAPGQVIVTELAPDRSFASVVTAGVPGGPGATLYNMDLASGEATEILPISDHDPVIAHHRDRTLFVGIDGDTSAPAQLKRVEMDTDLPRGEDRIVETTFLSMASVSDLVFEDADDSIVLLGDTDWDDKVDQIDYVTWQHGGGVEITQSIAVPEPQAADDPHYKWIDLLVEFDPQAGAQPGDIVLADPGLGQIAVMIVWLNAAGEPELQQVAELDLGGPIDGLSSGDGGRLYVTRNGVVEEYGYDAAAGTLARVTGPDASPLAGQAALSGFQITRSRTNFVPELHSGPSWENIDPSTIPPATQTVGDCLADVAEPYELLDLADVSAFVGAFVAQDPLADLNADGLFDLTDVTLFVDGFTGGCG